MKGGGGGGALLLFTFTGSGTIALLMLCTLLSAILSGIFSLTLTDGPPFTATFLRFGIRKTVRCFFFGGPDTGVVCTRF